LLFEKYSLRGAVIVVIVNSLTQSVTLVMRMLSVLGAEANWP